MRAFDISYLRKVTGTFRILFLFSFPIRFPAYAYLYRRVIARKQWGQLLTLWWRCIRARQTERNEYFFSFPGGYYVARCILAVVRAGLQHIRFQFGSARFVRPCQISIIGCPFRPTGGYSRNDVVTRKSASMLLPEKIAGQSVYLLDDTPDIDIEIVALCRF